MISKLKTTYCDGDINHITKINSTKIRPVSVRTRMPECYKTGWDYFCKDKEGQDDLIRQIEEAMED